MPPSGKLQPVVVLDATHEIAIYIHRFHNLDLFQQGWYQLKITVRWDNEASASPAMPSRVLQYEAPNLGCEGGRYGVWKIDEKDNSFATQPFRIKYARQDVLLFTMVAFDLPLKGKEVAVILKFELLYAPLLENGSEFQASPDSNPAAIHEFRIPAKALLGLHSYCPVYFDAFHAVLVDVSVHITLLKAGSIQDSMKVPSISSTVTDDVAGKTVGGSTQVLNQTDRSDLKLVRLVKALLDARETLIVELQQLSNAINQTVDLIKFTSTMNDTRLFDSSLQANQVTDDNEDSGQGKPQNGPEVLYVWSTFLTFHRHCWLVLLRVEIAFHSRDNKTRIMEVLHDAWAKDRKAEWSIWMVYSMVEMPHHYINRSFKETTHHVLHKRGSSLWKLSDDPVHMSEMKADLHRRSISQMKINSRSIQDMQIFGDPSAIPIAIVERVMNAPRRSLSYNSYMNYLDAVDSVASHSDISSKEGKKPPRATAAKRGRDLKGHHLDLRLVRNQWLLIDPKIEFLMSEANEDKTSGDFREMGLRLGQEVVHFIKKKVGKASRYGRLGEIKLSFVGHSIGNVIIRTAIADSVMEPYRRYLHTYLSLSGPHLGYLYSSNSLFNSGLWLLKKFKGTQCIHQLTFTDDPNIHNTFFYQLCKKKTLENFKNIILFSSPQDGYVPYHSARIESCRAASMDHSKKGKAFLEMLNACLDQIRASTTEDRVFMRCDVNFDTSCHGKNLNSFIGRAAHIEFLESDIFARFIMWSFPNIFK
ncbi:Serine esterase family protein, putative isoform 4 [Hibiscus syriacus]|uniref:Serine esterase family protein, putative isoform 4 n=1 Tax=Hibiscus syriacus TaxID=106335 RepID=A0A6A2XSH4_HIBSY|nr:Serine esterase family protein, putative isoform 4 [Hibiscus syriacus]